MANTKHQPIVQELLDMIEKMAGRTSSRKPMRMPNLVMSRKWTTLTHSMTIMRGWIKT